MDLFEFVQAGVSHCQASVLAALEFAAKWRTKQFTVGALNATLDLAAFVLVGVAAFLGSDVVLAPFGSLHVGWVLVGVAAFLGSVYAGVILGGVSLAKNHRSGDGFSKARLSC